eukprot:1898432-Pleurochrysis_carterae.AAC.1
MGRNNRFAMQLRKLQMRHKKGRRGSKMLGQRANLRYSVAAEANAGEDVRGMDTRPRLLSQM